MAASQSASWPAHMTWMAASQSASWPAHMTWMAASQSARHTITGDHKITVIYVLPENDQAPLPNWLQLA